MIGRGQIPGNKRLNDQAGPHSGAPLPGEEGPLSDERLLAMFVCGDEAALGELARRYEGLLLGLCTGMLGDRALAMEAVQETWLRVIRHGRTYDGRASVKTWVYQIAMNRCRDLGRARTSSRARELAHHERSAAHKVPEAVGTGGVDPRLEEAVRGLEDHQRETVILCYHRGLTHRQAAEVLGVPMGTVKSRLNKALEKLRETLGAATGPASGPASGPTAGREVQA